MLGQRQDCAVVVTGFVRETTALDGLCCLSSSTWTRFSSHPSVVNKHSSILRQLHHIVTPEAWNPDRIPFSKVSIEFLFPKNAGACSSYHVYMPSTARSAAQPHLIATIINKALSSNDSLLFMTRLLTKSIALLIT
jgi:hypothetical protein